ncbi:hypothetical protein ACGFNU_23220 [Spirillospora sp. NPDC048911]
MDEDEQQGRLAWLPGVLETFITVVVGLAFFAVLAYAKGML